jgi:hypothetical protein
MKRIGILVVAYNVSAHLARTLDRIPVDFRSRVQDVLVCDNHSEDPTYLVGLGYQQMAKDLPLQVIRHDRNLGYGGNQKAGYRWAIEHDLDIVVLLHGDGQYAPELLPDIVAPLEREECDAVFGSRMMSPGGARKGGMPLYKFVGNKLLTAFENAMVGIQLSEWHSGYRAFAVDTLRSIPFEQNTDDYNFDSQIIVQLHEAAKRIVELPIPTYYGDEISYVNGLKYAKDIAIDMTRYRLHKAGLGSAPAIITGTQPRHSTTAQERILARAGGSTRKRVLCLTGPESPLPAQLEQAGHYVTRAMPSIEATIPTGADGGFDLIVAIDSIERVPDTGQLLTNAASRLAPAGSIIAAVANFGHWYARGRVAIGAFDYDRRGVLDRDHLRFFTRRSFERLASQVGLDVVRREALAPPHEVFRRSSSEMARTDGRVPAGVIERVDSLGVVLRPTLFAYQFLYELRPTRPRRTLRFPPQAAPPGPSSAPGDEMSTELGRIALESR